MGRTSATTLKKGEPAVRLEGVVKTFGEVRAVDGLAPGRAGPGARAPRARTVRARPPPSSVRGLRHTDARFGAGAGPRPDRRLGGAPPRIGVMLQGGGAYPGSKAGEMLDLVASYSANPLDPEWLLRSLGCRTPAAPRTAVCPADSSSDCRWRALSSDAPNWSSRRADRRAGRAGAPAGLGAGRRAAPGGVSVLLTTHLMDEAEELADELVIIDHGRIVASGHPSR